MDDDKWHQENHEREVVMDALEQGAICASEMLSGIFVDANSVTHSSLGVFFSPRSLGSRSRARFRDLSCSHTARQDRALNEVYPRPPAAPAPGLAAPTAPMKMLEEARNLG